jgi:hypothetical protein
VLLPNGPELAVLLVARKPTHSLTSRLFSLTASSLVVISKGYCCAPLNPTATTEEIFAELQSTRSRALIILAGASISVNGAAIEAAERARIGVLTVTAIGD